MPALNHTLTDGQVANLPEKPAALGAGFVVDLADQPIEGGFDPTFGTVTWQPLISGDKTESSALILGVATFPAHGMLQLHRHTPPEFYFCTSGSGVVTMDGAEYPIAPGNAVYIPSDIEHGVIAGAEGLTFLYGFGEDAFSAVDYRFST